jgi:hypothetical protein
MTTRTRAAVWAALAVVVFAVTYVLLLGTRADLVDEAWMLWVTKRITSGQRLYSDVYFVSTPLAAWLGAAWALVGGVHLSVLREFEATVFTAELLVALSVARWCRATLPTMLVFGAAVFAVGSPATEWISLYSAVAIASALVALRLVLAWLDRRDDDARARGRAWALIGAGAACGVSFTSKPNIGLLALAAVVVALVVDRAPTQRGGRPVARDVALTTAGFLVPVVLMGLAVAASGTWDAFVSDVFGDKGSYMQVGTSYLDVLGRQLDVIGSGVTGGERALTMLHAFAVLLPVLIVVVVVVAIVRSQGDARRRVLLFTAFVVAAILSTVPRPGSNHFAAVAPLLLSATLGVITSARGRELPRRAVRLSVGIIGVLALASLAVIVVHSVAGYTDHLVTRSGFAHFERTAVPKRFEDGATDIRTFARAYTDGEIFVLREDAGFWYLVTGVHNPLPYDIPEVSDFGADGEHGVISRLAHGEADWVCVKPVSEAGNGVLEPRRIRHWVRTHWEYVATVRQCDMYRRPD